MAEIALRPLFDAGCATFHGNANIQQSPLVAERAGSPPVAADTEDDDGLIKIGVSDTPTKAAEYRLAYADLWAHGYAAAGATS
jgi:hypothetical protein